MADVFAGELPSIDGYVADLPYPSNFHQAFQPPWTDWNLERRGLRPPREAGEPFVMVDLGCGDALGLLVTAASHPQGRFIGVDAMPEHIAQGRALADAAGLANVELHCADFASALPLADGRANYVAAQGVLAWISEPNRAALLDLAARWLRPGGALTMGYNCFPGWGQIAGFQRLVRSLAAHEEGPSPERFAAAAERVRASGVMTQSHWEWLDDMRETLPAAYFAHEYLNGHWNPCWSGDVIAALAARGLDYAGQAGAPRLREDFCFRPEWREALATMPDAPSREIAADMLAGAWFRHDISLKRPTAALDPAGLAEKLLAHWWASALPAGQEPGFTLETPAGSLDFGNAAARAIMARLAQGPARLADIPGLAAPDLLNTIDALYAARLATPVDPPCPSPAADRFNAALAQHDAPISARATDHGALAGTG